MSTRPDSVTVDLELRLVVPVGRTIRDRIELSRRLRSLTTQSRVSTVAILGTTYFIALVVCISLSSPSGRALFEAPLTQLVEFLTRTYAVVPTGNESEHVDVEAELALLLWSEPPI